MLTLNSICFLYATFKAEKEWSFNGSFSIGGQCGVDVGCVNLGINISSIDLVGIDWDWGKGKVDTYYCEENNAILVFYKNSDIKIINEDGDKMTIMFREPLKTPY